MTNKKVNTQNLKEDNSAWSKGARTYLDGQTGYNDDTLPNLREKFSNPDLAIMLSGNKDKKSLPYKAALRRIQIWQKTDKGPGKDRKGSTPYRSILADIASKTGSITDAMRLETINRLSKGGSISITGTKIISESLAHHTFRIELGLTNLQELLRASIEGDTEHAMNIFKDKDIGGNEYPEFGLTNESTVIII